MSPHSDTGDPNATKMSCYTIKMCEYHHQNYNLSTTLIIDANISLFWLIEYEYLLVFFAKYDIKLII